MKAIETASNSKSEQPRQSHGCNFAKVRDGRKQPIRGLWVRNGRYYARLAVENPNTGVKTVRRVPLMVDNAPVETTPQALAALNKLKTRRADDDLPTMGRTPKFSAFADDYIAYIKSGKEGGEGTKKPRTIYEEEKKLDKWKEHLGDLRLDKIKPVHVSAFIAKRLKKVSKRTVKLDVIALRNVLKRARDIEQHIRVLPVPPGLNRELKSATPKRQLFTHDHLEQLCNAAHATKKNDSGATVPLTKNAVDYVDYIRLLAYSGARCREALSLRWDDVDVGLGQLTIGATGDTKNKSARIVDFNPRLKAHLQGMFKRASAGKGKPASQWLFPSPQRGDKDIHAETFRESHLMARAEAKLLKAGFHDLRHYFISFAVMAGIDYMTIAKWVGHRDGGILIGKVYGHLADNHAKAQAQRLNFGPVVLEKAVGQ